MNEIKKKYEISKKKLNERIVELEKEIHELRIRLNLINNISNGTIFNQEAMKQVELQEKKENEK